MNTQSPSKAKRSTSLDRAIIASIGAMAAMNLFVLAQQFDAAPVLADGSAPAAAQMV